MPKVYLILTECSVKLSNINWKVRLDQLRLCGGNLVEGCRNNRIITVILLCVKNVWRCGLQIQLIASSLIAIFLCDLCYVNCLPVENVTRRLTADKCSPQSSRSRQSLLVNTSVSYKTNVIVLPCLTLLNESGAHRYADMLIKYVMKV